MIIAEQVLPGPVQVDGWPSAVVTVAALLAVVVLPAVLGYAASRRAGKAADGVAVIRESLTTNNGGSSVRDRFDKLDRDLSEHLAWSQRTMQAVLARLDRLDGGKP